MARGNDVRSAAVGALVIVLSTIVAACSSGGSPAAAAGITVSGAWARPSAAQASTNAAYMLIANTGSTTDTLVGATSPVAQAVEVHETMTMGPPAASGSPDAGGMLGMQPVARLDIPASGSVELKPGSYHVMLIGLKRELKVGDTFDLALTFEKAGQVTVRAEVRGS